MTLWVGDIGIGVPVRELRSNSVRPECVVMPFDMAPSHGDTRKIGKVAPPNTRSSCPTVPIAASADRQLGRGEVLFKFGRDIAKERDRKARIETRFGGE